jgi:hypothetical protein
MLKQLVLFGIMMTVFTGSVKALDTIHEPFNSLDNWETSPFPSVENKTDYSIQNGVLVCSSNASSSLLKHTISFDPNKTPIITWKWKVDNTLKYGNIKERKLEDLPIRLYVVFDYEESVANWFDRILAKIFKKLYGEIPPRDSIAYVWANKDHKQNFVRSEYTNKLAMIPVDFGEEKLGTWQVHTRNILEDYKMTFDRKISPKATLAVLSDSENTEGSAKAYIDFITLSAE